MDGFKNTTKTQYSMGGYAHGGKSMGKVGVVMHEFGEGKLHSGSKKGPAVTNPKQAVAIALSEARKAGAKIPVKKADGGYMAPPKGAPMDTESSAPVKPGTGKRLVAQNKATPPRNPGDMTEAERKYAMAHETAMPGHKKGGAIKGPVVERAKSMSVKSKMSPSVSAQEMRTMQRYKAAMASRPNRQPLVSSRPGPAAMAVKNAIGQALRAKAAEAAAAPAPMAPDASMGAQAPMMKKGGKVMKKADGGSIHEARMLGQDPQNRDTTTVGADGKPTATFMRVWEAIRDRDRKDIDAGAKPEASKLAKMAAKEAATRLNRLGEATQGYNRDTGIGMKAPSNYKKGGKVMKKADGGMASSIRPTRDYHESDQDFVAARANQLSSMVGKRMAKGGMDDAKQDKAMAKADVKQDKAMIKVAIHKHEKHDHPGKPLTKLRKGGAVC